jgi:hypothetical protein
LKTLAKKTFTADLVREGSWGSSPLGKYESTMEVFANEYGVPVMIEWDIPDLEETEHIGLQIEGKHVTGYDGVMCIPQEAIDLLKELGYNTDEIE